MNFQNNRGQTLIQALVTIGIMSVIALGFAQMITQQNKEMRALEDRLAVLDLEKSLISATSSGLVCQYVMNNPAPRTFNSTSVLAGNPVTIDLGNSASPASAVSGIPGPSLAQAGTQLRLGNCAFRWSLCGCQSTDAKCRNPIWHNSIYLLPQWIPEFLSQ